MTEQRTCPLCTGAPQPMERDETYGDLACPSCGLCAPVKTLDDLERRLIEHGLPMSRQIAEKLATRGILDEAERLLRANSFTRIDITPCEVLLEKFLDDGSSAESTEDEPNPCTHEIDGAPTLAEAFAIMTGGPHG